MTTKLLDEKEIFSVACEIESDNARLIYLQQVCAGDAELLDRVALLLRIRVEQPDFLEPDRPNLVATLDLSGSAAEIGPYKIREKIGEGGMGMVYLAEQASPIRRKVALKVIKPGMDTKEVISRFEAERQTLALMDHPNISKVIDAGATDSGRPYFVMELVNGIPITEYCDQAKLSTQQRLGLFIKVCRAIQHAHQKGIIHRDIKPSNVLITMMEAGPEPKVIDFGVAKAINQQLTEQTLYTAHAQLVGTPLYMSPEQAERTGFDLDTRSDVYSLGVLLYELLTDSTPFDKDTMKQAGYDGMRRMIREVDPPRPSARISTLKAEQLSTISNQRGVDPRKYSHALSGELDWIVMQAMEKDRTRRYESANALAADIQRYLDDEPVQACPPTVSYRLTKYAKRHKVWLTTAATLVVMLFTSTIVSSVFAFQALQAKQDSDQSALDAKAAQQVAEQEKENAFVAQQMSEANFAAALDAVDKLLLHASSPALQEVPQAQPIRQKILEDVLAFYEQFKITTGDSESLRFRAASTWTTLGDLGSDLKQFDLGHKGYEKAFKLLEDLVKQSPRNFEFQNHFMSASMKYGWFHLHSLSDRKAAKKSFERVRIRADELLLNAAADQPAWIRRQLIRQKVQSRLGLATVAQSSGDNVAHQKLTQDAFRLIDGDFDVIPNNVSIGLLSEMANLHQRRVPDRADQYYRMAIGRSRKSLQDNSTRHSKSGHARLLQRASPFFQQRDSDFADKLTSESVAIGESLAADFAHISSYHRRLAEQLAAGAEPIVRLTQAIKQYPESSWYYALRGAAYRGRDEYELALVDLDRAIELNPAEDRGYVYGAHVFADMKQYHKAIAAYGKAIGVNPQNAWSWADRAKLFMSHFHKYEEALSDIDHAIELTRLPHFIEHRAKAHFHLNQFDKTLADLNTVLDLAPNTPAVALSISPRDVANCPDEEFKKGMQALADRAVKLNDRSAAALTARATLLIGLGESEQAFADIEAVVEFHPADHLTHNKLAWSLAIHSDDKRLNPAKAITLADRAIALAPKKAMYWNTLGLARYRAGEYESAIVALEKSEELFQSKSTPFNSYVLAMAHWQLGQQSEALDWYKKAAASMDGDASNDEELVRFRKEAEGLIETAADKKNDNNN